MGQEISTRPEILAGPMLGSIELRTAVIWLALSENPTDVKLAYRSENESEAVKTVVAGEADDVDGTCHVVKQYGTWYLKFLITGLEPATTYNYKIFKRSGRAKSTIAEGRFTTQTFWQWRTPPPDFSFITGSCSYFNQPEHDRVQGKPYGGDSSIFLTMSKENAAFMLWLGDNWYTRVPDYFSEWGLYTRALRDRSQAVLQPLLKAMPHYAIWDDHDFGPNDAGSGYVLKEGSRRVFNEFWCNPSSGEMGQGIYSQFTWHDVDFFLLDDRWFRSHDDMVDSIGGVPNKAKQMFGQQQMQWLQNALLQSNKNPNISFRIIVNGSQILNPLSSFDCLYHYSAEYHQLMDFLAVQKIKGILFLTGDRHHSEVIKIERPGLYPLYDITSSPLSSGIGKTKEPESSSQYRIGTEIDEQNYARFSFEGPLKQRRLSVSFIGLNGEILSNIIIQLSDLVVNKK
jgi:alkaline phosphatase D